MWYVDAAPVDLRTAAEWKCHHLPHACNVSNFTYHHLTTELCYTPSHPHTHTHTPTHTYTNSYSIGEKKQSESKVTKVIGTAKYDGENAINIGAFSF